MHPVHEYRQEVANLKAELAELKARLGIKPADAEPPVDPRLANAPVGAYVDPFGLIRNARGSLIPAVAPPTSEEYSMGLKAAREAEEKAEWEAMTAGLPNGYYRDPCGLVRSRSTGKVAAREVLEDAQLAAVERIRAQEHREWKVQNHLPVRPLEDEEEG